MLGTNEIINTAWRKGLAVPAFNIPYLPMMEPVIGAVRAEDAFALIEVARLEWIKFEAGGTAAVAREFKRWADTEHVRLHLDHIPVVDEDGVEVDYLSIIQEAIGLGYQSVMVDGSRLNLEDNIEATRQAAVLAHAAGVPIEAELGAVLGHEAGPLPPYEELFASGQGFTHLEEARRFVQETGCDWLSVAIGNVHGAISGALKDQTKMAAKLDLDHLQKLREATNIPLVLHGGSGIPRDYVLGAIKAGIAKINVGTEIRQAYEKTLRSKGSVSAAQSAVYEHTRWLLCQHFGLSGDREKIGASVSTEE
ncbi:MAG: class II fructose-bisphosphate aldolase [Chloroflexi bacterium]|nr:class II fructose-bisphosphate aldolase [Chloroflexota bacterium]